MSNSTHRLPIAMKTTFQDILLLTYAVPPPLLADLLPAYIHPYIHNGRSYISIVIGNMRGMRPGVLPEFLGTSYYQIVYRAVVCLRDLDGRERRGVFFLRSDSNDPVMNYFGNRLTEFRFHFFHTGAISLFQRHQELLVSVETADKQGDLVAYLRNQGSAEHLPPAEDFATIEEEKNTLVQLFHAYAYDPEHAIVYDLEIERGEWSLQRLEMLDVFSAFFKEYPFPAATARPISHIYIQECSYIWKPMIAIPVSTLQKMKGG
ncbi:DUF2071 domain-containing protein [Ktedonospora formicarum]|uniref:DUF2071 domain-containing protein n=1 Tax=Ktedonospora formicarum TaxID=2778364 RepID=A0A8J3MTJ8_9CHLR|nr:DUF2071 domain-containing protein [Ktedonospora formicarum]GHO46001.1 hypothetical protein KSX_41640 [Ktedonospora formicarum]